MNAIVTMSGGTNALTPTSMDSAMQLAEMMARGKLVPAHLQQSPGDCLMVIEAALRWQMSPFAVAQCTSVIQGKLMFEGKLVAAALNASGIMSSRLDYEFTGEGADRAVIVRGTLRNETKAREVTLTLKDAKTNNALWVKQTDQQLVYAGTRVWARRHAPEVMLGVYAPEEFDRDTFDGVTIDAAKSDAPSAASPEREAINSAVPLRAAATAMPRGATVSEPPKRTRAQFLDSLEIALRDALREPDPAEAVDRIVCGDEVMRAKSEFRNGHIERLNRLITNALVAVTPEAPSDPVSDTAEELPEIVGEQRVHAG